MRITKSYECKYPTPVEYAHLYPQVQSPQFSAGVYFWNPQLRMKPSTDNGISTCACYCFL